MSMLDYPALAALAAVVREGGFDRAAAALGVTPSAVSQRVRALEERLGAVLIVRGAPPVPTAAGARLCAHLEKVRLLEADLAADLSIAPASPPTLRIAVNADSLATWFPAAVAAFTAGTGALLDIALDDEGRTAARLRSGDALAAVTADPRPVPGCRTRPLGALTYAAVATPAFAARWFPQGVDAAALARAPVLRFDAHDGLQARWAALAAGAPATGPTHQVPSSQAFLDLALGGVGWAMNPASTVAEHLAAGRLVELAPGRRLEVALHWQSVRLGSALLDRLTRAVRTAARAALAEPA
jgi:LysR family transcriptional regulator (chromosome initiation inhibitor)